MKLLQFSVLPEQAGGSSTGGVGVHSWDLSNHLNGRGYSVTIAAHNVRMVGKRRKQQQGIDIVGLSPVSMLLAIPFTLLSISWWHNFFDYFGEFPIVEKIKFIAYGIFVRGALDTLSEDPDVVQIHHISYKWPVVRFELSRKYGEDHPPILVSEHGFHELMFTENNQHRHELIRRNLSESEFLLLNTEQTLDEAVDLFGEETLPDNTWTGINAIDLERYKPKPTKDAKSCIGVDPDKQLVVYVGRLEERKGIWEFVDALNQLAPFEFDVLIVGSGDSEEVQSRLANECRPAVDCVGYVDDLPTYYSAADLMVAPSYHEDFGLTFVESFACGTPVLGTTNIPKSVLPPDGSVGYRVPARDSDELATYLLRGLNRSWDREVILDHARNFGWEERLDDYERIYSVVSSIGLEKA